MPTWRTSGPLPLVSLAVFLLVLVPYALPILDAEAMVRYGEYFADIPLIVLVAVSALWRRPAGEPDRDRRFWVSFGRSFLVWLAARAIWLGLGDLGLAAALASDFVFLMLYLVLLQALEQHPDQPAPPPFVVTMRRYAVAGGTVLLLSAFAYFAAIPALLAPEVYLSWKPSAMGAVLFDIYLTYRLLVLAGRSRDAAWRARYRWLTVGFACWVVSDLLHVAELQFGLLFLEVGSVADFLWYVPFVPMVIGVLLGRRATGPAERTTDPAAAADLQPPLGSTPMLGYAFLLPLVHLALYGAQLCEPVLRPGRELLLLGETLVLAALVYRVHRLVLLENQRLHEGFESVSASLAAANRGLEARVLDRTRKLEDLNRLLAADIRKRMTMETRLRASESRNRALLRAIPDPLFLLDGAGCVKEVLPVQGADCALPMAEAVGQAFVDLLPARWTRTVLEAIERTRTQECTSSRQVTVTRQDDLHHLELRFGRCGPQEILVLVQDVTRRHQVEAAMLQSQKLESLGILAGGIAHDFNNLLAGILGHAQLALESPAADGAVRTSLAAIEKSALRAAKLTDNMLAYAGQARIQLAEVDLHHLLDEMKPLLEAAVPKKCGLDFVLPEAGLWIEANEAQLTQIVLNLVRNACEALDHDGGRVRVELDRVAIAAGQALPQPLSEPPAPGPYVRLRVRDNGCGMDAETRRRIFDPFFTSKSTGRGLGLAAVLGIVKHHRGAISLESVVGVGTEFTVLLPALAARERGGAAPAAQRFRHGSGTVLVADDEENVRGLMASYLSRLGFAVVAAVDGAQAEELYRRHRREIVAVLLDFAMPQRNGVEVLATIRALDPQVPVILMSGYSERRALADLPHHGRTHFLHKPFELNQFVAVLGGKFGLLEAQAVREGQA